jgi:hypothetical protein
MLVWPGMALVKKALPKAILARQEKRKAFKFQIGDQATIDPNLKVRSAYWVGNPDRLSRVAGYSGDITAINASDGEVQFDGKFWEQVINVIDVTQVEWEDDDPLLEEDEIIED